MKKGKLSGLLAGTVVLAAAGFIVYANLNAAPFGASSSPAAGPNGAAAARLLSDTGAAARAAPESPAVPQSGSGQNPGSRPDNPAASGAGRPGGGNPGGAPAGRSGGNAIVVDTAPAELGSLEIGRASCRERV